MTPLDILTTQHINEHGGYGHDGNQNQVLFLAQAAWECWLAGHDTSVLMAPFQKFQDATRVTPGFYHRSPERAHEHDAHDNWIGRGAMRSLLGLSEEQARDNAALSRHGWNFNNLAPGKWALETQMKPNDIAFLKICAGTEPTVWEAAWLAGHLLTSSSWNLQRLRLVVLSNLTITGPGGELIRIAMEFAKRRVNWVQAITDYYGLLAPASLAISESGGRFSR